MTIRHQTRRIGITASLTIAALAACTTLSACSGGGKAETSLGVEDSPLYKLLGPALGAGDDDAMREQLRRAEALIAQCMKDQGFEYTPTDAASAAYSSATEGERDTEKWAAEHGYGITESAFGSGADADPGDAADPNEEYVASLSEAEQAAYQEALHGQPVGDEEAAAQRDPATAGCAQNAYLEAQGLEDYRGDERYTALMEGMSELWSKAEKSPEVKAANAAWADCMADAGHGGLKKRSDAVESIMAKQEAFTVGTDGSLPPEPSAKELRALKDEEIELAVADTRCAAEVGHTQTQRRVLYALEEKFIEANRPLLDEFIDSYGDRK